MKQIKVMVVSKHGIPGTKTFYPVGDDVQFIKRVVSCFDKGCAEWVNEEEDYAGLLSSDDMKRFSEMLPFEPCYILSIQYQEDTSLF